MEEAVAFTQMINELLDGNVVAKGVGILFEYDLDDKTFDSKFFAFFY